MVLLGCELASASDGRINLTGRDLCWPASSPRNAALMMGRLDLGTYPWFLNTPDGVQFQIDFAGPTLNSSGDTVLNGDGVEVGRDGEMVTVFGGYASDEILLVCSIDER